MPYGSTPASTPDPVRPETPPDDAAAFAATARAWRTSYAALGVLTYLRSLPAELRTVATLHDREGAGPDFVLEIEDAVEQLWQHGHIRAERHRAPVAGGYVTRIVLTGRA
jgi:hypothetical protein